MKGTLKTCPKGHQFYKSSDCPTCPKCEAEQKPNEGLLSQLSAPARRALEHEGILGTKELSTYSEKEILSLHGMGPASLPIMREALKESGLKFRE